MTKKTPEVVEAIIRAQLQKNAHEGEQYLYNDQTLWNTIFELVFGRKPQGFTDKDWDNLFSTKTYRALGVRDEFIESLSKEQKRTG